MFKSAVKNVRTVCPYCGVGCGMILQVENGRITKVTGDREHPANAGRLCSKGISAAEPLYAADRAAFAQMRSHRESALEKVSLASALEQVATRLRRIGRGGLLCFGPVVHGGTICGEQALQRISGHQQH